MLLLSEQRQKKWYDKTFQRSCGGRRCALRTLLQIKSKRHQEMSIYFFDSSKCVALRRQVNINSHHSCRHKSISWKILLQETGVAIMFYTCINYRRQWNDLSNRSFFVNANSILARISFTINSQFVRRMKREANEKKNRILINTKLFISLKANENGHDRVERWCSVAQTCNWLRERLRRTGIG